MDNKSDDTKKKTLKLRNFNASSAENADINKKIEKKPERIENERVENERDITTTYSYRFANAQPKSNEQNQSKPVDDVATDHLNVAKKVAESQKGGYKFERKTEGMSFNKNTSFYKPSHSPSHQSTHQSTHPSSHPSSHPSTHPSIHPSSYPLSNPSSKRSSQDFLQSSESAEEKITTFEASEKIAARTFQPTPYTINVGKGVPEIVSRRRPIYNQRPSYNNNYNPNYRSSDQGGGQSDARPYPKPYPNRRPEYVDRREAYVKATEDGSQPRHYQSQGQSQGQYQGQHQGQYQGQYQGQRPQGGYQGTRPFQSRPPYQPNQANQANQANQQGGGYQRRPYQPYTPQGGYQGYQGQQPGQWQNRAGYQPRNQGGYQQGGPNERPNERSNERGRFERSGERPRYGSGGGIGGGAGQRFSRPQGGGYNPGYTDSKNPQAKPFVSKFIQNLSGRKIELQRKKKLGEKDKIKSSYKEKENKFNTSSLYGRVVGDFDDMNFFSAKRKKDKNKQQNLVVKDIKIERPMSLKELAPYVGLVLSDLAVIAKNMGIEDNKAILQEDIIQVLIEECGHRVVRIDERNKAKLEFPKIEVDDADMVPRSPIVTVVGHVDHGKTTLLDYIRKSRLASKEVGGITQSIGAYQVKLKDGDITFIDTPGHEAFSAMRMRGVKVTDIALLIVSAEEGVKPQTVEALAHIKAVNIPIIVVITKCDLQGANPNKARQDLLAHNVVCSEYGGGVTSVEVSAVSGKNIDKLLEIILLQAKLLDLKASVNSPARGVILESKVNPKVGAVATLLITSGTLNKDFIIADTSSGKIKSMINDLGENIKTATISMPVEVVGFNTPPSVGAEFAAVNDIKLANEIVTARIERYNELSKNTAKVKELSEYFAEKENISLILKAETQGGLEAVKASLQKLATKNITINFVYEGVGPIKESDIDLAVISSSKIISFNLKNSTPILKLIKDRAVGLFESDIIYHIIEDIEAKLLGFVKHEEREVPLGRAKVIQIFKSSKLGNIAGCMVLQGPIKRGSKVRVYRNNDVIAESEIISLRREKDDMKEVVKGAETGIVLKNFDKFALDDELQCYDIELVEVKIAEN